MRKSHLETLYHYCSNDVLLSIAKEKTLWLSSLAVSNDWNEGKILIEAIRRLAVRDGIGSAVLARLFRKIRQWTSNIEGFGFCLSAEGDLLSQWRAYGADGTGVALGFRRSALESLADWEPFSEDWGYFFRSVAYEETDHEILLGKTYLLIREYLKEGAFADNKQAKHLEVEIREELMWRMSDLFFMKTPHFKEEKEWRLLSVAVGRFRDECQFRTVGNSIVPYRTVDFGDARPPLTEIILGPRNGTPEKYIKELMGLLGYRHLSIRRSETGYRSR